MYFWTPHWAQAKYDLTMVQLPEVTPAVHRRGGRRRRRVRVRLPAGRPLQGVQRRTCRRRRPRRSRSCRRCQWTNDDQNVVAAGHQRRAWTRRRRPRSGSTRTRRVAALGRRRSGSADGTTTAAAQGRAAEGRPPFRVLDPALGSALRFPQRRRCVGNTVRHHRVVADLPARAQTVIVGAGIVGACRRLSPRRAGRDRRAGDRPGPAVRDRRLHLARAGHHLPDERLPHDVPDRAGLRRALRLARAWTASRSGTGSAGSRSRPPPSGWRSCKRRQGFARSYGIEGTELLSPGRVRRALPLLDPVDGPRRLLGPERRRRARRADRRRRSREARRGRGRRVRGRRHRHRLRHDRRPGPRGRDRRRAAIECERVLLCAGHLGADRRRDGRRADPAGRRAAPAGVDRPDPRARRAETTRVEHPILRHQDMSLYFRQRDDHYGVGNYRHEPIVTPQSAIRAPGRRRCSPR